MPEALEYVIKGATAPNPVGTKMPYKNKPDNDNYTAASGPIRGMSGGKIKGYKNKKKVRQKNVEVTHGVFFGENIRRVIKALRGK